MAVGQGFEPWELLHSTVFKTAAFDHSATPPERSELYRGLTSRQPAKPLFFKENESFLEFWADCLGLLTEVHSL